MTILVSDPFDATLPKKLTDFGTVSTDPLILQHADILVVGHATKVTKDLIDAAPNLKLIIRGGIGFETIDMKYAMEKKIAVRNTPKASAIAAAELTIGLMFAAASRIPMAHLKMEKEEWGDADFLRTELFGKTLCLIGTGAVGTQVAERASALGMHVVAYRKSGKPSICGDVKKRLEWAVEPADVVSLHIPLTVETKGMIHSGLINRMKQGTILINTSRATCVVPEDVVHALETGRLAVYATDVWPSYPPRKDYPILRAPNVIKTPRMGGKSRETFLRMGDEIYEIIKGFKNEN